MPTDDGLKITPELDSKYKKACELCHKKHMAIYGCKPIDCAYRAFDNEYCPDITDAEKSNRKK